MKRFIKYFLCLLISLCVFAGTGCGFDIFGSGSGSGAGSDAPLIIRMLDIGRETLSLLKEMESLRLLIRAMWSIVRGWRSISGRTA